MKENPEEQNNIREYLLGRLTGEASRRRIEEKLLLDDDYAETLEIAETELIEEYLDGSLNPVDAQVFNEFFLAAPERKKHLQLIKNLHRYAAQPQSVKEFPKEKKVFFDWRGWFAVPAARFAFAALIVCAVGFAVWRIGFYEKSNDLEKGLAQVQTIYRGQRPVESRLTIDFGYTRFTETRSGFGNQQQQQQAGTDATARRYAERLLQQAAENSSQDARARHALGLLYLAEKKYDDALREFNRALESAPAPDSAGIYSDRSVVYLEKARSSGEREKKTNLKLSLQDLNRALEIDNSLKEALFNKALVIEETPGEEIRAIEAWEKYLEKDSSSDWAAEARAHLEDLREKSSSSSRQ
jgi:tetratricopeptide (TPR) repeat protein